MNWLGVRVAGEEARDVAVLAVVLTGLQPREGVQQVVHADRDQRTVGDTEDARAHGAGADEPLAEVVQTRAQDRPDETEEDADDQAGEGRDDRDESAAAEEAQPLGQLLAVVALVEQRHDDAHHDAAEDSGVDRRRVHDDLAVDDRGHLRQVAVGEGAEHLLEDQVTGHGGERRGAVRLLGETDRHAHGEEQRHVAQQRIAAEPTCNRLSS
ncbi:hypothetical protein GCM10020000_50800 [Streptomyces olivoverticillatus]